MNQEDFIAMFAAVETIQKEKNSLQLQLDEVTERLGALVEGQPEVQIGRSLVTVVIQMVRRLQAENMALKNEAAKCNGEMTHV